MKKLTLSPRPDNAPPAGTNQETLPFLLSLILVGVAGNIFHFHIFFDIDFLFGSIFSLLTLQLFGQRRGVIAAALISACTIFLWNQPYTSLILIAEVAVVGWLFPRRKIGLVLADTLYWLCLGMPLIYLFYHGVMEVSAENVRIVMIKQAVNGIANALLARLLFAKYSLLSRNHFLSFREIISTLLGLFILCPSLLMLAIDSRADFAAIDQRIRTTLVRDSEIMGDRLKIWLNNRKAPIVALAKLAATLPPPEMQSRLEQTRASDPNFLRVVLHDPEATTIASAPLLDELGHAAIGRNYSDRPFIPLLKKTLQPMLSEVVMARTGTPKPVVHMLAPVIQPSGYAGCVLGALNLATIEQYLETNTATNGRHFVLLDRNGVVISSNAPEQKVMTPFSRGQGKLYPLEEGLGQWVPTLPARTPTLERWKSSAYIKEKSIDDLSAWTLILEQPIAPFQKQLNDTYTRKLSLLFLILLGALFLAETLSRNLARSNEELQSVTADLPHKLAAGTAIAWPESSINETKQLVENFRGMATTLTAQFSAIRKTNASLKERVEERTQELSESRERYDLALLGSQNGIWDWNVLSDEVYFSGRCFEMLGYAAAQRIHNVSHFEKLLHPDDLPGIQEKLRQHFEEKVPYSNEFRVRKKEGEYSWIQARGQALWNKEGEAIRMAGSLTDINERKKAENLILASLREKEVLLKEIHHRVKNNLQIVYSLLTLQANGIADNDIKVLFNESRDRIGSMALIHEKLYNSSDLSYINFSHYLQELTQNIASTYQRQEIKLSVEVESIFLDINSGIPCGLIVNELVSNSYKHAFPKGEAGQIRIGMTRGATGQYQLTVADNGGGVPPHVDIRNPTSLGLQLVSVLTKQLQGEISLNTDAGTRFIITFSG